MHREAWRGLEPLCQHVALYQDTERQLRGKAEAYYAAGCLCTDTGFVLSIHLLASAARTPQIHDEVDS